MLTIIALDFDGGCGVQLAEKLSEQSRERGIAFWSPDSHLPASRLAEVVRFGGAELLIGDVCSDQLASMASESLRKIEQGRTARAMLRTRRGPEAVSSSTPTHLQGGAKAAAPGYCVPIRSSSGAYAGVTEVEDARSPLRGVILGSSQVMREVRRTIADVAPTRATVLISGPSGTGKELVARSIHNLSRRNDGPFVPVNLAAIAEGLAESQLFGHEKGAFTNALERHDGFCRAAHNGTLFLDEISEMPVALQPKLLRFMQEKKVQTLGLTAEHAVDARIVAAMNRAPDEVVRQGQLREDLYFRLNVVPIRLPPLRERRDDIEDLAKAFLRAMAEYHERDVRDFTAEAIDVLCKFDWPGNVRQLENAIERIVIFCRGETVDAFDIPGEFHGASFADWGPTAADATPDQWSEELTPMQKRERAALVEALQRTGGHVVEAAALLGIGQATLYRKIKQFDISRGPRRRRRNAPR
ncbi:sigma-54-dependent transcriptional regulator [Posidoniimonas polymericola]|uniref:sigma-54-dependent transcriptional regulator n=1 Tax=Posidoniimonas polymericola TaxID=2528002 RepID=UPI0018D4C640|nr:sigma-54 dependent transcriptional regulator [Posidoniimonas polymericola]